MGDFKAVGPHPSRRGFLGAGLAAGGLGLLAGCGFLPPATGQTRKLPRIGLLGPGNAASESEVFEAFRQGLRELGYVDGQSVTLVYRYGEGKPDRLPALAGELVEANVDVIVADSPEASAAARNATRTIPIVVGTGAEAELGGGGRVSSLAHPGGNVTGFILSPPGIHGKRLALFKEAIPSLSRVAVIWDATTPPTYIPETRAVAPSLGVTLQVLTIRVTDDIAGAVTAAVTESADGLFLAGGPLIRDGLRRLLDLSAAHRLPTIFNNRPYVDAGGLMCYGANTPSNFRRAAGYVVKILEGAKPGDLPVQQPTTYDFIINLKAARALGLTIPPSVLAQATAVIP